MWQSAALYREPDHPETVPLPGLGVHKHHFTIPVGAIQNQLMYACEVCGASSDDRWRALEEIWTTGGIARYAMPNSTGPMLTP